MLVFLVVAAMLSSLFYYLQALLNGLGCKRWALMGLFFGPMAWPMFCMKKRMKIYQRYGMSMVFWRT